MVMSASERVKKAQLKTDAIMLRPKKAIGEKIRAAAAAAGESVSGYILSAVFDRMKKDGQPVD
jgi:uncharacterized protein (DUF1778 family)